MMRFLKVTGLVALVYAAPLTGAPHLILDFRILILALAGAAMLLSQPDMSKQDAEMRRATDHYSVAAIMLAGMVSHIIPVVEWGYFGAGMRGEAFTLITWIGLGMVAVGLTFRIWSIRVLGQFFTSTVQIVDGHRVVKSGPYAIIRHPSYLGAYLAIVGSAVTLGAPLGAICASALMFAAYRFRISVEEETLVMALGDEYHHYQDTVPAIVPFVRRKTKSKTPWVSNRSIAELNPNDNASMRR